MCLRVPDVHSHEAPSLLYADGDLALYESFFEH